MLEAGVWEWMTRDTRDTQPRHLERSYPQHGCWVQQINSSHFALLTLSALPLLPFASNTCTTGSKNITIKTVTFRPRYIVICRNIGRSHSIIVLFSGLAHITHCRNTVLSQYGVSLCSLGYKPEGRGFETRWGEILNLYNPSDLTRPRGLLSLKHKWVLES
jgi:hypothetical protein